MNLGVNTQLGDQLDSSSNTWDLYVFKIHKMSLRTTLVLVAIMGLIIAAAWRAYRKHVKKQKDKNVLAIT
jgi:hypothetical protein